jgi:hypothetical protein
MALTSRCYLFEDGGVIKRIPRRLLDGSGKDAMPEYANSVQRIATAIIENETGKPIRVVDASGGFFSFNEEGKIDEALRQSAAEAMDLLPTPDIRSGNVVSLSPQLKRRQFREKHRWDLTKEDLDWIASDIWPNDDDASRKISVAAGREPRRPPLPMRRKKRFARLTRSLLASVSSWTGYQSPRSKGSRLRRERELRLRVAFGLVSRTNATTSVKSRADGGQVEGSGTPSLRPNVLTRMTPMLRILMRSRSKNAAGKRAAAEAARRLLKEHAHSLREDMMLRSALYCELEWEPPKDR